MVATHHASTFACGYGVLKEGKRVDRTWGGRACASHGSGNGLVVMGGRLVWVYGRCRRCCGAWGARCLVLGMEMLLLFLLLLLF